jgi:hypothetical protein
MDSVVFALLRLAPERDSELIASYHHYSEALSQALSPEQYQQYAEHLQRHGALRMIDELAPTDLSELTPEEQSILAAIRANRVATEAYRQVAVLLRQRGHADIAPVLDVLEIGN